MSRSLIPWTAIFLSSLNILRSVRIFPVTKVMIFALELLIFFTFIVLTYSKHVPCFRHVRVDYINPYRFTLHRAVLPAIAHAGYTTPKVGLSSCLGYISGTRNVSYIGDVTSVTLQTSRHTTLTHILSALPTLLRYFVIYDDISRR